VSAARLAAPTQDQENAGKLVGVCGVIFHNESGTGGPPVSRGVPRRSISTVIKEARTHLLPFLPTVQIDLGKEKTTE
jgi:hypothetical protein